MDINTDNEPLPNGESTGEPTGANMRLSAHAGKIDRLRAAFFTHVTPKDLEEVIGKLVELAKGGDVRAIQELLNRLFGKVPQAVGIMQQMIVQQAELERPATPYSPEEQETYLQMLREGFERGADPEVIDNLNP